MSVGYLTRTTKLEYTLSKLCPEEHHHTSRFLTTSKFLNLSWVEYDLGDFNTTGGFKISQASHVGSLWEAEAGRSQG